MFLLSSQDEAAAQDDVPSLPAVSDHKAEDAALPGPNPTDGAAAVLPTPKREKPSTAWKEEKQPSTQEAAVQMQPQEEADGKQAASGDASAADQPAVDTAEQPRQGQTEAAQMVSLAASAAEGDQAVGFDAAAQPNPDDPESSVGTDDGNDTAADGDSDAATDGAVGIASGDSESGATADTAEAVPADAAGAEGDPEAGAKENGDMGEGGATEVDAVREGLASPANAAAGGDSDTGAGEDAADRGAAGAEERDADVSGDTTAESGATAEAAAAVSGATAYAAEAQPIMLTMPEKTGGAPESGQTTGSEDGVASGDDEARGSAEASSGAGTAHLVAKTVAGTEGSEGTVSCQRWTPAGCSVVPGKVCAVSTLLCCCPVQG